MKQKVARLTEQLPATPCTPEMRRKIEALAEESGVSIAAVQRVMLAFFLLPVASETIIHASKPNTTTEKTA